jgi:endonuclease/exonuclease/phosphatase family metal-dependent hydrolase
VNLSLLRLPLAAAATLLLGSCGTAPPLRTLACSAAPAAPVTLSPDGRMARATLSVLTYNIEGLGWPARATRGKELHEIAERLARMRAAGTAPDVVLFQEMFSGDAKRAVAATGYPAIVTGPRRTTAPGESTRDRLPGKARLKHGEVGLHLTGSGLAIASRYPVIAVARRAYGRRSCAGFDCLANKGIVQARVVVPGVPTPIDLYDTHMNSRGASRAPANRNLAAHDRQALEASRFIDDTHDDSIPVIFGGDFNMRHSEERWENFTRYQSMLLVHRTCSDPRSGCEVRMSWQGDQPWMNTQDLQFYWRGDTVEIRPVRVEAMFDDGPTGPALSDHHGFLVTYELRWRPGTPAVPACHAPQG